MRLRIFLVLLISSKFLKSLLQNFLNFLFIPLRVLFVLDTFSVFSSPNAIG